MTCPNHRKSWSMSPSRQEVDEELLMADPPAPSEGLAEHDPDRMPDGSAVPPAYKCDGCRLVRSCKSSIVELVSLRICGSWHLPKNVPALLKSIAKSSRRRTWACAWSYLRRSSSNKGRRFGCHALTSQGSISEAGVEPDIWLQMEMQVFVPVAVACSSLSAVCKILSWGKSYCHAVGLGPKTGDTPSKWKPPIF